MKKNLENTNIVDSETGELVIYNEANELTVADNQFIMLDDEDFIGQLLSQQLAYTSYSLSALEPKTKALYFNAVNNTTEKIRAHANTIIWVKDIYVTVVTLKSDNGDIVKAPRTVLIDKDGIGYGATSKGVWGSVKNLIASFGEPSTWKNPLPLKVALIPKDEFLITTLSIDIGSMK